jgi:hypothetical protein
MNAQQAPKRRQRRTTRLQRRDTRKPKPTFEQYRSNPDHFAARMKSIRERAAGQLFSRATPQERERITQKLILPWKWYASKEQFFNDLRPGDLFFPYVDKYRKLMAKSLLTHTEKVEARKLRIILGAFGNNQVGFVGEFMAKNKTTVVVIIGRDMTPEMIQKEIKKYLLRDETAGWKEMTKRKH